MKENKTIKVSNKNLSLVSFLLSASPRLGGENNV
jgi:hypothetical protein